MNGLQVRDDRGRLFRFGAPPRRIVSLVPSDTYNVVRLGAGERLVGRTSYCVEPAEAIASVPEVGGTKDADVDRILALEPDLVLANQEENTKTVVERLEQAGVRTFVSFPQTFVDAVGLVARLARILGNVGDAQRKLVKLGYDALVRLDGARANRPAVSVFVPIWADPLMTANAETYIGGLLDALGARNVFAGRERRYPLAADLGKRPAKEVSADHDTRYPRITLEEVTAAAPDVILLPDEPHPFSEADADRLRALDVPAARSGRIHFVSGRDLMWPGLRSVEGIARLEALLFSPLA